jgi:hypothetical protein
LLIACSIEGRKTKRPRRCKKPNATCKRTKSTFENSKTEQKTRNNMDPSAFTWELRIAQAEAMLRAAERDKAAALAEEARSRHEAEGAAAQADNQRLALAEAEARRYGLAAELMTCAKKTTELRERAAKERSEATA